MAYTNLAITTTLTVDGQKSQMDLAMGGLDALQNFENYLGAISGGNQAAQLVFSVGQVQATGSYAFTSVIATDAFSINGVAFTCVANSATGNQFNVGGDDEESVVNAAAAVNASVTALVAGVVTASASGTTLTITADEPGTSGNLITITSADATIVASGARLTGGSEGTQTTISNI